MYSWSESTSRIKTSRLILALCISLAMCLSTACNRGKNTPEPPAGTYKIDPLFLPFYNQLGGQETLGLGISPIFRDGDKIYQYTSAALLMYDSEAPEGQRVSLAPLGRDLGIYEQPVGNVLETGGRLESGYKIFDKFLPLFDQLGGTAVAGQPLTEWHFNPNTNRYEQYFENLGFYWLGGADEDDVHLLSYGAWKCASHCEQVMEATSRVSAPSVSLPAVVRTAAQLGLDFTGFARNIPIIVDGQIHVIYDNVVFLLDQLEPNTVKLLALPEAVGYVREDPAAPSPAPDMDFYPTQENLGYNIPHSFIDYIQRHGGFDFVGQPITYVSRPDPQTLQQCFVGLCLQGRLLESGEVDVRVMPLGVKYSAVDTRPEIPAWNSRELTVQIWESYPMISPGQEQEIGVAVLSGGLPVENVETELTLRMPSGDDQSYLLPATDENGETSMLLPALQAENGTLIPYKACVQIQSQPRFCVVDSFLVWQTDYVQINPLLPPQKTSYLPFIMKNATLYLPAFLNTHITYLPFLRNQH